MPQTKIATCTFCGTKAALVLRGTDRHELSCAACGAPLHDLKMLRTDAVEDTPRRRPGPVRTHPGPTQADWDRKPPGRPKRRKKKKRKGLAKRFFEEAFDAIEDIFD